MRKFNKALFVLNQRLPEESAALTTAINYAKAHGVELHFICVLPDLSRLHFSNSTQTLCSIKQTMLNATAKRAVSQLLERKAAPDEKQLNLSVVFGKEYIAVCKAVLHHHYDVVIKQACDPSWLNSVLGSDDLHLLRKCPSAVWLIDSKHKTPYRNVAAAIDFSDDNTESELNMSIAEQAAGIAIEHKARMHILSVCDGALNDFASMWANNPEKFERDYLDEEHRRRRFAASYIVKEMSEKAEFADLDKKLIHQHILKGDAKTIIPEKLGSLDADLLVMGTIARSGISGMLIGNTAESILLQLPCSVLALKPLDFKTPITQ